MLPESTWHPQEYTFVIKAHSLSDFLSFYLSPLPAQVPSRTRPAGSCLLWGLLQAWTVVQTFLVFDDLDDCGEHRTAVSWNGPWLGVV